MIIALGYQTFKKRALDIFGIWLGSPFIFNEVALLYTAEDHISPQFWSLIGKVIGISPIVNY